MIDALTSEKDLGLGVTIDQQRKFSDHIQNAVKKANRVLGCLVRTFRHLNKDTFLLLYKAMVRPHLEYASCIWCPHLIKDRDLIEQVQRRATRLVSETKGLPYNSRLKELQLPTFNYRRQNRHNPDFQNYQKNRLGQPGLPIFTVPIKADVQKR